MEKLKIEMSTQMAVKKMNLTSGRKEDRGK